MSLIVLRVSHPNRASRSPRCSKLWKSRTSLSRKKESKHRFCWRSCSPQSAPKRTSSTRATNSSGAVSRDLTRLKLDSSSRQISACWVPLKKDFSATKTLHCFDRLKVNTGHPRKERVVVATVKALHRQTRHLNRASTIRTCQLAWSRQCTRTTPVDRMKEQQDSWTTSWEWFGITSTNSRFASSRCSLRSRRRNDMKVSSASKSTSTPTINLTTSKIANKSTRTQGTSCLGRLAPIPILFAALISRSRIVIQNLRLPLASTIHWRETSRTRAAPWQR